MCMVQTTGLQARTPKIWGTLRELLSKLLCLSAHTSVTILHGREGVTFPTGRLLLRNVSFQGFPTPVVDGQV